MGLNDNVGGRGNPWEDSYLKISSSLAKDKMYLWKNKHTCQLKKIGTFGSQAFFPEENVYMVIDNVDLEESAKVYDSGDIFKSENKVEKVTAVITKDSTSPLSYPHVCIVLYCNESFLTPQELGKHRIKSHGQKSREEIRQIGALEKKKRKIKEQMISDLVNHISNDEIVLNGVDDGYKVKYEALLEVVKQFCNSNVEKT